MSRSLSPLQSMVLGLVVLGCLAAGGYAMLRIGEKQGLFGEFVPLVITVPDAQEVEKGTLVKIRGVEAGQVVAVEYPEEDAEDSPVRLHIQIDKRFQDRIYADAKVSIASKGLLGTRVISIQPGKPKAGRLTSGTLHCTPTPDIAEVTAKLYATADRAEGLLKDIQQSQGTIHKLLKDDELYKDFRVIAEDTKKMLSKVNGGIDGMQKEMDNMKDFVRRGQDAITSLKQDADAIKSMPIVRNYVQDAVSELVRPNCNRDRYTFAEADLFEANRAILTDSGREKLNEVASWLVSNKIKGSDVVVVSFADPKNKDLTPASAQKLTEKQSEVVLEYLKERGVHKLGWWSRRKVTAIGQGIDPSPVVEKETLPPAHTQILLFIPQ